MAVLGIFIPLLCILLLEDDAREHDNALNIEKDRYLEKLENKTNEIVKKYKRGGN
jgi:hypothetical protein